MESKMSKGKMVLFLAALFLTNVAVMADMVIVPTAASLYTIFGDQVNLVNFIISGPALILIVSSLICGKLMQYLSKKTLLIAGFGLFTVASIFGGLVESAMYLAVMRALVGFSMGIINVAAIALLAETYADEEKRSRMMGLFNAAMAGIGAILGFVAGFFAAESWQSVFKVYWIAVPILVMIVLFIPKTPPEKENLEAGEKTEKLESIPKLPFIAMNLAFLFFNAIYMVVYYQIAVYVLENAIGNESVAGLMASLGTLGSLCACSLFGFTYGKLKRGAVIPSYAVLGICYAILMMQPSIVIVGITCTFMGAAYGNGFSYYYMRGTVIVPPGKISTSMGVVTAVNGLGMFISTYMSTMLQNMMSVTTVTGIMPALVGVCIVATVLSIGCTIRNKKYPSEYQQLGAKIL